MAGFNIDDIGWLLLFLYLLCVGWMFRYVVARIVGCCRRLICGRRRGGGGGHGIRSIVSGRNGRFRSRSDGGVFHFRDTDYA